MQLIYRCPACQKQTHREISQPGDTLRCESCGWSRVAVDVDFDDGRPARCLTCGCDDLWRQKDFPQRLGLLIVGLGILLSTIAVWYWRPFLSIGILMVFALGDMLLYALMNDVLVCYRCGSRHRSIEPGERHVGFNLETAERHRQEAKRLGTYSSGEKPI